MSCTLSVMYQPYAMPYSSTSCDRTTSERQKLFKFPLVPSPPDSSSSAGGSPSSSGTYGHTTSAHSSSAAASTASNFSLPLIPPPSGSAGSGPFNYHHHHHHHLSLGQQQHQLPLSPHETSPISQRSSSSSHSRRSLTPCATVTSDHQQQQQQQQHEGSSSRSSDLDLPHTITSASTSTSHHNPQHHHSQHNHHNHTHASVSGQQQGHTQSAAAASSSSARAQYLSANCVVYENYAGDSAREVDEHFSKALSVAYGSNSGGSGLVEKSSGKSVPMSTRNFPPSFWDSAYQPPVPSSSSRPLTSYGHSDFYGSAASMDYTGGLPVPGLHHQGDPWHYPLAPHHHHHHHQSYHHHHRAAADLAAAAAYTPMPSSSRFNPAQYSSFLFPSTAAASAASRFPGVKGDTGHWGAGGRYHPHESSWSDFHLADYSAAAAHYSNITAAGGNF